MLRSTLHLIGTAAVAFVLIVAAPFLLVGLLAVAGFAAVNTGGLMLALVGMALGSEAAWNAAGVHAVLGFGGFLALVLLMNTVAALAALRRRRRQADAPFVLRPAW